MLTQEKIEEMRKDIEDRRDSIDSLEKENAQKISTRNADGDEMKEMEAKIASIKISNQQLNIAIQNNTADIAEHRRRIAETENMLEEDAKEKAIKALVEEQPCFWKAAEARLAKIQDELKDELPDFSDFIDPEEAIKNIRHIVDTPLSFNELAVYIRNTIQTYTNYIRDLCERKHNGVAIPLSLQKHKTVILDNFLNSQQIEVYWSRG